MFGPKRAPVARPKLKTKPLSAKLIAAQQAPPPVRLLGKAEVLQITGVSFPTVWAWMRAGTFPRSRIVGGKSMWRSDEIDAWLAGLKVRPLKGDAPADQKIKEPEPV
jgi:predicted DNA-binding transcriptional regulator AlpA